MIFLFCKFAPMKLCGEFPLTVENVQKLLCSKAAQRILGMFQRNKGHLGNLPDNAVVKACDEWHLFAAELFEKT